MKNFFKTHFAPRSVIMLSIEAMQSLAVITLAVIIGFSMIACDNNTTTTTSKTLSSIAITTLPTKTVYVIGENLDTSGMVVTATYSDGSTASVTSYSTSSFDSSTAGVKTITVSYNSKTTTFTVRVIGGNSRETAITLTENKFSDGYIVNTGGEQWFKFTATAATQYIHFDPGTLSDVYVQLYDSSNTAVGSNVNLYSSSTNTSQTVTVSSVYYIKVKPYSNYSGKGSYKIGFTTSTTPPRTTIPTTGVTTLIANKWTNGNIATADGEQWFSFTANTTTGYQYIHFNPGTLPSVYVKVYDNTGTTVGSRANLSITSTYTLQSVTNSNVYYIKVTPYSSSGSGAYKIAFGTQTPPPSVNISSISSSTTTLTINTWANGEISTTGGEQWFKFTATATTQYIYFFKGTLDYIYVQLYDNNGSTVGNGKSLYGYSSGDYTSLLSLTSGNMYYFKVFPYYTTGKGAYKIGFGTSSTVPSLP